MKICFRRISNVCVYVPYFLLCIEKRRKLNEKNLKNYLFSEQTNEELKRRKLLSILDREITHNSVCCFLYFSSSSFGELKRWNSIIIHLHISFVYSCTIIHIYKWLSQCMLQRSKSYQFGGFITKKLFHFAAQLYTSS